MNKLTKSRISNLKAVKKYQKSENGKAVRLKAIRKYQKTEKGKLVNRKSSRKYQKTRKGIEVNRKSVARYCKTKKGKASFKRYCIRHPERQKARSAVMMAVRKGRLSHPNTLLCHYCSVQAEQYHHWKGYAPEHWLDVVPVCMRCHNKHKRKVA